MLKLFFYRSSPFVYLMNALCLGEIFLLLSGFSFGATAPRLGAVSGFLVFSWVFFNFLNGFPWYRGKKGKLGIRLHFQKNIVPLAYLLAPAFALKIAGVSEGWLLPFAIVLLPMYYVSVILLSFHYRDKSDLIPGYFSHNFYLQEEKSECTH